MRIALVLAAGGSARFGRQKLLAPYRGVPLVRRTVEHALDSAADGVLVVVGREGDGVRRVLSGLPVTTVHNPFWKEGMAASIRTGVAALPGDARSALVVLGDQPEVEARIMNRVLGADPGEEALVVVPVYREGPGNPVLFREPVFPELLELVGDRGARRVVERRPERVLRVTLDAPMPRDVDTPDDLRALEEDRRG